MYHTLSKQISLILSDISTIHRGIPAKKFVRNDESKTNITILIKKKI